MSPFIIKAIQLILSLSLLIVLHELGHFIPAKIFKTRVEKFFLFFDVKFALFKKKIGDTVYGIGWLPLGGYVKISGMIDESMDKEQMAQPAQPWEFRSKPAWQRLIIMLGGVTVNLILGFLLFMMILFVWGTNYMGPEQMPKGFAVADSFKQYGFQDGDKVLEVNGETLQNSMDINRFLMLRDVETVTVEHQNSEKEIIEVPENIGEKMFKEGVTQPFMPFRRPVIDSVIADNPAIKAGLQKGDSVISVNGEKIKYWNELTQFVQNNKQKELAIAYQRGEEVKSVKVTPNEEGKIGIVVANNLNYEIAHKDFTLAESISEGFKDGYWTLRDYVYQFKYVFTKKGATQVGGFGAIGGMFPDAWNWQSFWHTTALISIILAFMNILPIPALDGGHVIFLLYEIVTGRKPNEKFMEYAQMVGFFILIALVLYANGNDIYRAIFDK